VIASVFDGGSGKTVVVYNLSCTVVGKCSYVIARKRPAHQKCEKHLHSPTEV